MTKYSPILGGFIAGTIMICYSLISANIDFIKIYAVLPLVYSIFISFSYILDFSIGKYIRKIKIEKNLSNNVFLLLSLTSGAILGLIVGFYMFSKNNDVGNAIVLFFATTFCFVFNSSMYIELKKIEGL